MPDRVVYLESYDLVASLNIVYENLYEISITRSTREGELVRTAVLHSKYGSRDAKKRFLTFIEREYPLLRQ